MSESVSPCPVVLNLTSTPDRFAPDVDLVERELKRLMEENQVLLDCDEVSLPVGPRRDGQVLDQALDDRVLRQRLHDYARNRLTQLKFVLLLDRWPKEVDAGIQERLGVYVADLTGSLDSLKKALGGSSPALQQLVSAQNKGADPVPVAVLLMEAIIDESIDQQWSDLTDSDQHCWLTRKVLHHELGHHVFPLDESDSKKYGTDDQVTKRAEAGANWYAWMIGSPRERDILRRFSDDQTEPYRAYRELIEWAASRPLTPGGAWGTQVLTHGDSTESIIFHPGEFQVLRFWEQWGPQEMTALMESLPRWLAFDLKNGCCLVDACRAHAARSAIESMRGDILEELSPETKRQQKDPDGGRTADECEG